MNKKIIVITGASSGIGLAISEKLKNQNKIIMLSRTKNLNIEQHKNIEQYFLDVTDPELVEKTINHIQHKYKTIDVLINCAGIAGFGTIDNLSDEEFEKCIQTNLMGTFYMTKYTSKIMKNKRKGQIININSIAGVKGFKYGAAYVSSKYGVEGLTQATWQELKNYEVKVCIIRPGIVDTPFLNSFNLDSQDKQNIKYALDPEDIASTVDFIINQSEKSNISEITIRPIKLVAQNLFIDILNKNIENGG